MPRVFAVIGALAMSVGIVACGSSSGGTSTAGTSQTPSSNRATVSLGTTSLGSVLVDDRGRTLYELSADTAGKPTCTGGCLGVWPQLKLAKGSLVKAGDGVTGAVSSVDIANGSVQVTIAAHPLYTYSGDSRIGEANGDGITSFGGTWHVVSATGAPVTSSGSSPSPTSTGSGGGYNY
jgi:predicted lipoprotein with Yx(FWY)xxD motif